MTTATTSTVIDHTSDAGFRTWGLEMSTQLAAVGLSKTVDTGQINWATVTRPSANTAAGYEIWRFTDALNLGPLATVNAIVGGASYTNGTYTAVPLTGGTGSGAKATIVVAGAVVTTVTITTAGTGYNVVDQLSAAAANIGGTGSGFTCNAATLTSGSPIVFKLEYGTSGSAANPGMWTTVGQGSNGAGTLIGNLSERNIIVTGSALASTVTSYTSRWCYNTTYGILWFGHKYGSTNGGNVNSANGGIILTRTNDSTGAATGDGWLIMFCNVGASGGGATSISYSQSYSFLTSLYYPTTALISTTNANFNLIWPSSLTSSLVSGNNQVMPAIMVTPAIQFSNTFGICVLTEITLHTTFSATIVGSTPLTYISAGDPFGGTAFGTMGSSATCAVNGTPALSVYALWQ